MAQSSTIQFTAHEIEQETNRLFDMLQKVNWTKADCELIAPLTLEINQIKKEKNAVILAHSYQTPDIIFGVADISGDSLGLSKAAAETDADIIVFAGVIFMAETAKILSPDKTVLAPSLDAGCSLADSITREDVIELKNQHPGVPVVAYVNTSAEVKAEADICVTSANVMRIIDNIESEKIIFLPDHNMANYIKKNTEKEIIDWQGKCIVHEEFKPESVVEFKSQYVDLMVIAHSECPSEVLEKVDLVGGTGDMQRYIEEHPEQTKFFLVTECGLSDRFAIEYPDREFYGTCNLCPYMKEVQLRNILQVLNHPREDQFIRVDDEVREKAVVSINRMLEY